MLPHLDIQQSFDFQAFLDLPPKPREQTVKVDELPSLKKNPSKTKTERKKKNEGATSGKKFGHWDNLENKKYHWFLEIYHQHFLNRHRRRVERIFKVMEAFLETREAEQCRSHHQKMQKRHGTFPNILLSLRKQHYGNQQASPVYHDLVDNNIELKDGVIERENLVLQEGQGSKDEEIDSIRCDISVQGMQQQGKFIDNWMEDGYSNCINFHDFYP